MIQILRLSLFLNDLPGVRTPAGTVTRRERSARPWRSLLPAALLFALAGLGGFPGAVQAAYPDKPITIVVPYPVGGATDTLARSVGQKISETFHQPVVVENRAGGSGLIGMSAVARAPADGYTILFGSVADAAIYAAAASSPPAVNLKNDFMPVAAVANAPHILVVPSALPVSTVGELVAYLKAAPGKYNYASIGVGTLSQLEPELLKLTTGVDLVHVPYRGGSQALMELIAGNSTLMFLSAPNAVPHVKSGKIKVLTVASNKRLSMIPEVPTISESGVQGFNARNLFGFYAPKGVPDEIVARLSAEISKALQVPEQKARLEEQGLEVAYANPAEFGRQTEDDFRIFADIVKKAGIKLE